MCLKEKKKDLSVIKELSEEVDRLKCYNIKLNEEIDCMRIERSEYEKPSESDQSTDNLLDAVINKMMHYGLER